VRRTSASLRLAALGVATVAALVAGPTVLAFADDPDPVDATYDADFTEQETDSPAIDNSIFTNTPDHTTGIVADSAAASTMPGGSWPDYSASGYGSTVRWGGHFRGVVEDMNRGTRIEALVHLMEPGGDPDRERGVYGRADWYGNTQSCYPTSMSSASCTTSWYHTDNSETGRENANSTWQYWYQWDEVHPTYNSGRGAFKGCIDVKWHKDKCTATIIRGSHYN
jgi:hypothetical protein